MIAPCVKVGSSSVTPRDRGAAWCGEIVRGARADGHTVVVVTSGAIAAGLVRARAGGAAAVRPGRPPGRLGRRASTGSCGSWQDGLEPHGVLAGQVLLAPLDFVHRTQYLHARGTLRHLLDLGVVPVVNENDAVADEEIRFGDNDRLAALVAHLVGAELLVLLTDTPGLLTADPRRDAEASLIEEVVEIDHAARAAGRRAGQRGRAAGAWPRSWPRPRSPPGRACETVIADAGRPGVLAAAAGRRARGGDGLPGPGPAALGPQAVDRLRRSGPRAASSSTRGPRWRWPSAAARCWRPGWSAVTGRFVPDDAVEIAGPDGEVFAKGLVRLQAERSRRSGWGGRQPRSRSSTATTWCL